LIFLLVVEDVESMISEALRERVLVIDPHLLINGVVIDRRREFRSSPFARWAPPKDRIFSQSGSIDLPMELNIAL